MKVTEHTKDRLWQDMFDLARLTRYYEFQTNHLVRNHRIVRLVILLGSGATLTLALGRLPEWIGIVGSATLLVATAVEFIWDWGTKASLSHAINLECCVIEKDYEDLWSQVSNGQIGDKECLGKVNQLSLRVIAASALLSGTDRKINDRANKIAKKVLAKKWRPSSEEHPEVSTAT